MRWIFRDIKHGIGLSEKVTGSEMDERWKVLGGGWMKRRLRTVQCDDDVVWALTVLCYVRVPRSVRNSRVDLLPQPPPPSAMADTHQSPPNAQRPANAQRGMSAVVLVVALTSLCHPQSSAQHSTSSPALWRVCFLPLILFSAFSPPAVSRRHGRSCRWLSFRHR